MSEKPTVLVLGGCGFIGRNLVHYLISNELVSSIRVVDKTPPQMAWLNEKHSHAFKNPLVEFYSANLINAASCKQAFAPDSNKNWDIVVNCAAETRPNQTEAVYKEGIFKLSINCANEAANLKVKRYFEMSSGCMNSSEKIPLSEDCKVDPWTCVAKFKHKVEKELKSISDLKYTVFRLPIVYGPADKRYLTPRIVIASLYKYFNESMKLLWDEKMKLNTVHVSDVVAAIWDLSKYPKASGEIYNIVDDQGSTQGSLSEILAEIFSINVDYWGIVMSSITKVNMVDAVSEINDKHMGPWAEVCKKDGVEQSPLTPYMYEEFLYHKHLNLNNTKLKEAGYQLIVPNITTEKVKEVIDDYVQQKLFPRSLVM